MREIAEGAHPEYDDERKHRDIRSAYHGHPYYNICEHWMIVQADNVIAVGIGSRKKTRTQAARIAFALAYALHHKSSCSDNLFQKALKKLQDDDEASALPVMQPSALANINVSRMAKLQVSTSAASTAAGQGQQRSHNTLDIERQINKFRTDRTRDAIATGEASRDQRNLCLQWRQKARGKGRPQRPSFPHQLSPRNMSFVLDRVRRWFSDRGLLEKLTLTKSGF